MQKNTIIIIFLAVLAVILVYFAFIKPKNANDDYQIPVGDTAYEKDNENSYKNLSVDYVYQNYGFTIELPLGYTPNEQQSEGGPAISITLQSASHLSYVKNASWWEQYTLPSYTYLRDEKIREHTFKVYTYSNRTFYWFKQGNVGYEFSGDIELLKTFKFVGW